VAVAEDGDFCGEAADFLHAMGDIDDGYAVGEELVNAGEELFDFRLGEGGGGFIEDEKAALAGEAGSDLDHLLLADAELADGGIGREGFETDLLECGVGLEAESGLLDESVLVGESVEEEVFGDGEGGDEVEFLHDHADAVGFRVASIGGYVGEVMEGHGPFVRGQDTAEDFGEGAFACAVFADEGVDFAGVEIEVDPGEGAYCAEAFAQVPDGEQRFGHVGAHFA
jgi:hypothetical protein